MLLSRKTMFKLLNKKSNLEKPAVRHSVHLEMLEDRMTPSAGVFVPPPATVPAAEAMAAYISAQPRSLKDLRLLYNQLRGLNSAGNSSRGALDVTPPAVANVEFSSSAWTAPFLEALGNSHGFAAETGANQLRNLPWGNIDTIRVSFTEDVNVASQSLILNGVNLPAYSVANFSYDQATFAATWKLTNPINTDKLVIRIDGTGIAQFGPNPVTDLAGNRLQGTWFNGESSFPSGNGQAGVDFDFRFNVAPGDIDRSGGPVTDPELQTVRAALFEEVGSSKYSVFMDLDGSGTIRNADMNVVRNHIGFDLPGGEPVANSAPKKFAATASNSSTTKTFNKPTKADLSAALTKLVPSGNRRIRGMQVAVPAEFGTWVDAVFATTTN